MKLDLQGHRGCRGLFPENSIEGFLHALSLGVDTLEMDVVITKDFQVVVSHEPYLNHEICDRYQGLEISEENELEFNIFRMDYKELKQCNCGSKAHPRFPFQKKMPTYKPLLKEVFKEVKNVLVRENKPSINYNIEIKSTEQGDKIFHPPFDEYVELVMEVIRDAQIIPSVCIQSFDPRVLHYMHSQYPEIRVSYLVENNKSAFDNISQLGFVPNVYSPDYTMLTEPDIAFCKQKKALIIPWTVNEVEEMQRLIAMGVDGLISDYPDKYLLLTKKF